MKVWTCRSSAWSRILKTRLSRPSPDRDRIAGRPSNLVAALPLGGSVSCADVASRGGRWSENLNDVVASNSGRRTRCLHHHERPAAEQPHPAARNRSCHLPQLQEIIYRALERDPKNRYAKAREFAWDLNIKTRSEWLTARN